MSKRKLKKNRIVGFALIAFTAYIVISLTFMSNDIKEKKEEIAQMQNQIDEKTILNKELQDVLDKGVSDDYVIKVAREKLKFVFPEERVYRDVHKDVD